MFGCITLEGIDYLWGFDPRQYQYKVYCKPSGARWDAALVTYYDAIPEFLLR